jgi:hypothetical protein
MELSMDAVMDGSILVVELKLSHTNEELLDKMRFMKKAREEGTYTHIVANIRFPKDDGRDPYDLPEVRAFCRRVVSLGFIFFLESSIIIASTFNLPGEAKKGWGAYEIWLCGEGRLTRHLRFSDDNIDAVWADIDRILAEAQAKSNATIGPFQPK